MDLGRSCMMCKHCIDLGSPGYSELTPGQMGRVSCTQAKQQDMDAERASAETFRAWIRFGNSCQSFEGAE